MIFRLILAVVIVYLIYRLTKSLRTPSGRVRVGSPENKAPISGEELVKDPWCGTYVPLSTAYKVKKNGDTLYFCSKECFEKYESAEKGRKKSQ